MTANDQAHAEERQWRRQREEAAARLREADRTLRLTLLSRLLPIVAFLGALPDFVLTGALLSGMIAVVCLATLGFNVLLVTPRCHRVLGDRRYALERIQQRYDEAFARMLAAETGEVLGAAAEVAASTERAEHRRVTDRIEQLPAGRTVGLRDCPACGEPGSLSVAHHERHVVGDNETWIVCSGLAQKRLWRYDPHAPVTKPAGFLRCSEHPPIPGPGGALIEVPELGCAGCASIPWEEIRTDVAVPLPQPRVTFSCPLCGAPGHRSGPDAHDIAVPEGHERQITHENEVWIVCPEPMSWTKDRWRYEWS